MQRSRVGSFSRAPSSQRVAAAGERARTVAPAAILATVAASTGSRRGSDAMRAKDRAATRIQAGFRGYRVRKQLRMARAQGKRPNGPRRTSGVQGTENVAAEPAQRQQKNQEHPEAAPAPVSPAPEDPIEEPKTTETPPQATPTAAGEKKGAEEKTLEQLCATKIQAGVRGFLVRRRRLAQHRAACTIQTSFRAFRARRNARLRAAAKI